MTVKELIEQLQKLPEDMTVVIPGYEGYSTDIHRIASLNVDHDTSLPWYYGEYEYLENQPLKTAVVALLREKARDGNMGNTSASELQIFWEKKDGIETLGQDAAPF